MLEQRQTKGNQTTLKDKPKGTQGNIEGDAGNNWGTQDGEDTQADIMEGHRQIDNA